MDEPHSQMENARDVFLTSLSFHLIQPHIVAQSDDHKLSKLFEFLSEICSLDCYLSNKDFSPVHSELRRLKTSAKREMHF